MKTINPTSMFAPTTVAVMAVFLPATTLAIDYLPDPLVKWTEVSTPPTGKNNAVQIAPDNTLLFVTSIDGTLTALDPETGVKGSIGFGVLARPIEEDWTVECESAVAFYEDPQGRSSYVVYAVIDVPPRFSNDEVMSRVFAMNHPMTKNPRWISDPLPGRISGTPVISSDGEHIYFTRNTESEDIIGHFTILSDSLGGELLYTESNPIHESGVDEPWAPVGIVHNPVEGNYLGGKDNSNDLVAWGTMPGSANEGFIYAFQLPVGYSGHSTSGFGIVTLQEVRWSTTSSPTLSESGYDLYFGISFNRIRGWVTRRFGDAPTWRADMDETGRSPPPSASVLSSDEQMLFVASTEPVFYAFDSQDGDVIWMDDGLNSVVQSMAQLSPDGRRVYYVESDNGQVHSVDAIDGDTFWSYSTGEETLADFSISTDGSMLYFGSTEGRVVAIQVGEVDSTPTPRPTPRPTRAPTPLGPTRRPSSPSGPTRRPSGPTRSPTQPSRPTRRPTPRTSPSGPTYEPTPDPTIETGPPSASPSASPSAIPTRDSTPSSAMRLCVTRGNVRFISVWTAVAALCLLYSAECWN